jgi:ubiquinone/menaquinone biosynthesis C-methylase UbiE
MDQVSSLVTDHLERLSKFYDSASPDSNWAGRSYRRILGHYYRHFIPTGASVLEVGCGSGELLASLPNRDVTGVDISAKQIQAARERLPYGTFHVQAGELLSLDRTFDVIILSETLNLAADVQALLGQLRQASTPETRLICNFYSSVWRPVLALATALGIRARVPQSNWLSTSDVRNLCDLADWEFIKVFPCMLCPVRIPGLERFFNRFVAPLLPWLCLTVFAVARIRDTKTARRSSVTVVVPARNEAGNIENTVQRIPSFAGETEIVFIEGHSVDNTWQEIKHVVQKYPDRKIKAMKQGGSGKGNAVREGFAAASGEILMILDADLTVPPEELPKFYEAVNSGRAEFANGVRLVYPMEERAMQFFNLCANKIFGLIFSWLLGQPVKDTLCGTKALRRSDYERMAANRRYFGDFDPFGDFDLLFGASKLNLKIADIPIRYRERTYGTTNIQRWKHGWLLFRMVCFAARKLKFI